MIFLITFFSYFNSLQQAKTKKENAAKKGKNF